MTLPKQKKNESDADYAARLEAVRAVRRRYYQANREAILEHKREYRKANKELFKEIARKRYQANREAMLEQNREYREANKEAIKEKNLKKREAKALATAKGRPLRSDFQRAQRPQVLTKLIIKVAEDFCRNYGFPLESRFDTDILRHAAETVRDSPELDGAANPWYGTDYLSPALIGHNNWASKLRLVWRNKV